MHKTVDEVLEMSAWEFDAWRIYSWLEAEDMEREEADSMGLTVEQFRQRKKEQIRKLAK